MSVVLSRIRLIQIVRRIITPVEHRVRFGGWVRGDETASVYSELIQKAQAFPPVFVFQMGKVASTSIFESLQKHYPGPVTHAHTFGPCHPSPMVRALYKFHHEKHPAIKIISLVREPVTRNISAFFQNFKRDTGHSIDDCQLTARELKRKFLRNYPHEVPLIWFDKNIKKHFGIDVYATPFPDCGHVQIQHGNIALLLMRHDLDNSLKTALINDFVQVEDFELHNRNVAEDKQYAHLYRKLQDAKLPLEHLYYLASSKYMHHFFKPEMGEIIRTWSDQPIPVQQNKAG